MHDGGQGKQKLRMEKQPRNRYCRWNAKYRRWNASHNTTWLPFGTNTYSNAGFASPGGLPTSAPDCSGFWNTSACMNTLQGLCRPDSERRGCGRGIQASRRLPADAYYPTWLKGIVYLQWSGTALSETPASSTSRAICSTLDASPGYARCFVEFHKRRVDDTGRPARRCSGRRPPGPLEYVVR